MTWSKHTIESPCHQLLDYEEYDDCCDIILNGYYKLLAAVIRVIITSRLTYVVAVLNVKEAPEAETCKSKCSISVLLDNIH